MRRPSPLALVLLATLLGGNAAAATERMPHVRGLNGEGRDAIAAAIAHSQVVRALVDALQATDVVVYVTVEPLPDCRRSGYLTFLTSGGGTRYLVVKLDSLTSPRDLAALLGHELQHALEVAAAPDVRDAKALTLLYERIGWQAGSGKWESDSARKVGEDVLLELAGFRFASPAAATSGLPDSESSRPQAARRR